MGAVASRLGTLWRSSTMKPSSKRGGTGRAMSRSVAIDAVRLHARTPDATAFGHGIDHGRIVEQPRLQAARASGPAADRP